MKTEVFCASSLTLTLEWEFTLEEEGREGGGGGRMGGREGERGKERGNRNEGGGERGRKEIKTSNPLHFVNF